MEHCKERNSVVGGSDSGAMFVAGSFTWRQVAGDWNWGCRGLKKGGKMEITGRHGRGGIGVSELVSE